MDLSVNERVREFIKHQNISQTDLRKNLAIRSRAQVSNWFTGVDNIPEKYIIRILKAFSDLNANWLIRGEGEMLNNSKEMAAHALKNSPFCEECIELKGEIRGLEKMMEKYQDKNQKLNQMVGDLIAKLELCQEELEGGNSKANAG